jgi:hypothetical protein
MISTTLTNKELSDAYLIFEGDKLTVIPRKDRINNPTNINQYLYNSHSQVWYKSDIPTLPYSTHAFFWNRTHTSKIPPEHLAALALLN